MLTINQKQIIMNKNYLSIILSLLLVLSSKYTSAQSTEDFESEISGSNIFTDNGQSFTISSESADTFGIYFYSGAGWNGNSIDDVFIDNTGNIILSGDGTSFTISTTDGVDITIKSFYLFVSNRDINGPGTPTTVTIEGRRNGNNVFTVIKSDGIVNGSAYTPNNGYTFIDLATEGGTDNSNKNIDKIIIRTTGNADYLSLDAFTWDSGSLSLDDFGKSNIKIFPNPSSDFIQISGLNQTVDFKILDLLGKEIKKGTIHSDGKINIQDIAKGTYSLKLGNANGIKLIKN
tara:strand:- start:7013 stop:7879 length:867 start_codon:yes stop_codon:yes gene_type:complete